jgi:hypothetical protein
MKPYDDALETLFGDRIDAQFPYYQREKATALIEEGRSISANAAFYVLDEICRPPFPGIVTPARQRELAEEWAAGFEHPLKGQLLRCAEGLISGQPLTWVDAVALIEEIGLFEGQRAALSIAYFAGDCSTDEGDAALTEAEQRVRRSWDGRDA